MNEATGSGHNTLFISHNAADRAYAVAIESAIHELLDSDSLIDVRYSTSDEAGPQGGETWRDWIYRQVIEARTALFVVTPHALGKPWLVWEAGACWGATLAQQAARGAAPTGETGNGASDLAPRLNVSIAYGLVENECPDPLRGDQIILGANLDRVKYLLERILQVHNVPTKVLFRAGGRMQDVLQRYEKAVRKALLQAPSLVTEANVQDWLSRLEELVRSNRLSELVGFQRWMTLAFGRDGEAAGVPIDVRLHRRLGELHLAQKDSARAAEQLVLARRAAPRDVYVLRPLVEVSIKQLLADTAMAAKAEAREYVASLLAAIEDLDENAYVSSPEAAAQCAKYYRRVIGDPRRAAAIYTAALRANANSYYLADLLAQTQFELGEGDKARETYRLAIQIVDQLGEDNLWSNATAATACLALGDIDGAKRRVLRLNAMNPTQAELESIDAGFRDVAQRSAIETSVLNDILAELRPAGGNRAL